MRVVAANGNTTFFEGNTYDDPLSSLFKAASNGTVTFKAASGTAFSRKVGTGENAYYPVSGFVYALSNEFQITMQSQLKIKGQLSLTADKVPESRNNGARLLVMRGEKGSTQADTKAYESSFYSYDTVSSVRVGAWNAIADVGQEQLGATRKCSRGLSGYSRLTPP